MALVRRVLLALALLAGLGGVPAAAAAPPAQAPEYVVVIFKPGTDAATARAVCAEAEAVSSGRFSGTCTQRFSAVANGFSGAFTPGNLSRVLSAHRGQLAYVERDAPLTITGQPRPDWIASDAAPAGAARGGSGTPSRRLRQLLGRQGSRQRRRALPEQADPNWDLDRLDQRDARLDGLYHYDAMGSGVNVYVIDTGIRFTHTEFRTMQGGGAARARPGFSAFGDGNSSDCNGHGTHTAATIGGLTYGVAKNVTLWAVRAMDCAGDSSVSMILAAFDWIANNHQPPALVSMSVTGQLSPSVNEAARRLVEDFFVPVVVAAGNDFLPACSLSPAGSPAVITVGASDEVDKRWTDSNWGPCVDLHAPGVDVISAVNMSDAATKRKTGTSMAVPHVAGVLALYLEEHPGASPTELRQQLNAAAEVGVLQDDPEGWATWRPWADPQALDITTTPNRLLYSLLRGQATLVPPILWVGDDGAPLALAVALATQPRAPVAVSLTVPAASWTGSPLASLTPASWTVQPSNWSMPVAVVVAPGAAAVGTYFLTLSFASGGDFLTDGTLQTVKVMDARPLTGDAAASPRVVAALPFTDAGDTSSFHDDYALYAGAPPAGTGAPDVVYSFTPAADVAVDISTCGSMFDTVLHVLEDSAGALGQLTSDDDPSCAPNPKASRLATTFAAGRTYFVVVDGWAGEWITSMGAFALSITPSSVSAA